MRCTYITQYTQHQTTTLRLVYIVLLYILYIYYTSSLQQFKRYYNIPSQSISSLLVLASQCQVARSSAIQYTSILYVHGLLGCLFYFNLVTFGIYEIKIPTSLQYIVHSSTTCCWLLVVGTLYTLVALRYIIRLYIIVHSCVRVC